MKTILLIAILFFSQEVFSFGLNLKKVLPESKISVVKELEYIKEGYSDDKNIYVDSVIFGGRKIDYNIFDKRDSIRLERVMELDGNVINKSIVELFLIADLYRTLINYKKHKNIDRLDTAIAYCKTIIKRDKSKIDYHKGKKLMGMIIEHKKTIPDEKTLPGDSNFNIEDFRLSLEKKIEKDLKDNFIINTFYSDESISKMAQEAADSTIKLIKTKTKEMKIK